jgi:crotonobetainyl-CoA:carnitine CoA-transferase CaiB-like acyl-CoA transferase
LSASTPNQVLAGIRVIDLGQALAGPFAATMLGDFGAEVIKVERPGAGDPMRRLGPQKNGVPLWWKAAGRNKKSITLDFTAPRGREILLDLVRQSDVVVENFRPGTLERHGLGWDELSALNPRLVMLRISGFGQTGPESGRPGFGRVAEAMAGSAQLSGYAEGPPIHVGYSLADTLAGLMGAYGLVLALLGRDRTGRGECIDVALFEPLFRLIDWQVTVYEQLGMVPMRAGNHFPELLEGVAAGVGQSADGIWLTYSAATDSVLVRLIALVMGQEAFASSEYATAIERRIHCGQVEAAVEAWIAERDAADVEAQFAQSHAVIGRVFDMEAIWSNPTYRARDDIVTLPDDDLGEVSMHGVVPKLVERPGKVQHPGPSLGEHTAEILKELAGVDDAALAELKQQGII